MVVSFAHYFPSFCFPIFLLIFAWGLAAGPNFPSTSIGKWSAKDMQIGWARWVYCWGMSPATTFHSWCTHANTQTLHPSRPSILLCPGWDQLYIHLTEWYRCPIVFPASVTTRGHMVNACKHTTAWQICPGQDICLLNPQCFDYTNTELKRQVGVSRGSAMS